MRNEASDEYVNKLQNKLLEAIKVNDIDTAKHIIMDIENHKHSMEIQKKGKRVFSHEELLSDDIYNLNERSRIAKEKGYNFVYSFSEGLARVKKDGKYVFIDHTGKMVM